MSQFTLYQFESPKPDTPRCKNTHTLSPLFALLDEDGEMATDPVPIPEVPMKYFWVNSEGYGFDVRNLARLIRVNFRNLNPHTIDAFHPGPIWCNRADMNSLLNHPEMPPAIAKTIQQRSRILNALTDTSKELMATVAGELYSFSYQGFYDWVLEQPDLDTILGALGMTTTRLALLNAILGLQVHRRRSTLAGIRSHLGVQAVEHFCEPAGIERESELYAILEFYKAEVVTNTTTYIENLAAKKRDVCHSVQQKLHAYIAERFDAMSQRYARMYDRATASRRQPGLSKRRQQRRVQLWHIHLSPEKPPSPVVVSVHPQPSVLLPHRLLRARRRLARVAAPPPRAPSADVHIRLFYTHATEEYSIVINNTPFVTGPPIVNVLFDTVPHFLDPRRRWRVVTAAVTGQVHQLCRPAAKWKPTIRADNRFLRSVAQSWVHHMPFTQWIEDMLVQGDAPEKLPIFIADPAERLLQTAPRVVHLYRDAMHRRVYYHLTENAPEIFEFRTLNDHITLKAGYDDFAGSLLDKLRAAMANRTCIQDVGGELCEMLSLPYPPEEAEAYARFQCDQTNIPPAITAFSPMQCDHDMFEDTFDDDFRAIPPVRPPALPSMTPISEASVESAVSAASPVMNIQLLLDPPETRGGFVLDI